MTSYNDLTIYTSIEQLQNELDVWMNSCNIHRTHSRKFCFGKNLCRPSLKEWLWRENMNYR
jgi:hypothetical protein